MSKDAVQNSGDLISVTAARRFLIQGHVQAMFFRECTVTKAREMGVMGLGGKSA
ncbi:acylphosphatase [Novosphingobium sp. G106]|uniref:acylphosphatase n=1 Tax=Novosphingobium sp. G106 TaxID=2849500 RepID=UPI001C2D97F6|nr:acylphosphatase [Novosphingobium sp. G106]MBV1689864.1 acylphosphatase [Novosphingobium sp. G106]